MERNESWRTNAWPFKWRDPREKVPRGGPTGSFELRQESLYRTHDQLCSLLRYEPFSFLSLSLLLLILLSFALLLFPFFQRYSTRGHFPFFASLIRRRLALTSSCVKSDRKVLRKLSEELGRLLLLEDRNSGEVSQIIDLFRKTNFESIFRFIMFVEFKRYSMKRHRKCFNNKRIIN